MEPPDLDEVKRLHEQCFPVRYDMVSGTKSIRTSATPSGAGAGFVRGGVQ